MTKKIRLTILLVCALGFFIISPVLVLYSMGYRFDFEKMKITATGGIYVRTFPAADKITIDSKISEKPGIFSNAVFVQSLLPNIHTVSIQKARYFNYSKTLPVKEKEVTKLENVLLIRNSISFASLGEKIAYFAASPNNQNAIIGAATGSKGFSFSYFNLDSPKQAKTFDITQAGKISEIKWSGDSANALISIATQGNKLYYLFDSATQKPTSARLAFLDKTSVNISFNPHDSSQIFFLKNKILYSAKNSEVAAVIKNIADYKILNNNILWLSPAGMLNSSDISGKLTAQLTDKSIVLSKLNIFNLSGKTFLQTNGYFSALNPSTKKLENIAPVANNYKILISQDGRNMVYWSGEKIYIYSFADKEYEQIYSGANINYCQWLNNDYIIFTAGDKIMISEIDYRGSINIVPLAQQPGISSTFYNPQNGKAYILTNGTLLETEKIIP